MPRKHSLSRSMNRIDGLIHSTLDFDEVMQKVMAEAAQAVGSETAAISLRRGGHWVVSYVHGLPRDVIGTRMDDRQEPHAVLAIETKKPVVINDTCTDERVNRAHMKEWGVRSVLVVPLVAEDEALGVLSVNRHQAGAPFTDSHVDFVNRLASSVSLAVRNARLFEQLQAELAERRRAEEALQEACERLQAQNDELRSQREELQAQAEELRAQTEEVTTANEELRENEQALRRSEQRYRSLFENMLDGYAYCQMLFDDQGRPIDFVYLNVNEAFGRLTGLPDVIGKKVSEVIPGIREAHPELLETYGRVAATGRPERFVLDFKPLEMWLSVSVYSGCPGYFTAVFDNITERRRAEMARQEAHDRLEIRVQERTAELRRALELVESERQRFQQVLDQLPAYLILLSPDHRVPFANRFFEQRFGKSEGRRCYEYLFQRTEPCASCQTYRVLETNTPQRWEWTGPDGRNYDIYDFPFTDVDGTPLIMEVGLDITERKQAEAELTKHREHLEELVQERTRQWESANAQLQTQSEEARTANQEMREQEQTLRENEERLRLALEGGQMGRWEWDLAADSMFWCARAYELLGLDTFRRPSVATLLDCVHPDDRQAVKDLIARVMNEAQDFQAEFRVHPYRQEPRGEVTWLALHAKVIRDEQEQAIRTIGVLYDITPRKQMETELRRLNEKLEEEVRAQTKELRGTIDRLQDEVVRRVLAEGRLRKSSRLLEAFFQHTVAPLAFLDRQFRFVRVNEAYAQADGRTPEFFVHQDYFSLYPGEEGRAVFEHVVRTKQPYEACAKLFPFSGGAPRPLTYWNWRITPLLNDAGEVQFIVFSLEDVTDRQKAFGELEQRARQLQKLTLELAQAEDRERRRLAEILHDDLQQVLAAAKFHLGLLHHRVKGDAEAKELADHLIGMLREAIEKSRSLSHELSPAVLYQSDLSETFEWLARQVQAKHGLTVHTEVHGRIDSPSEPVKAFLFRAAQEILFNAVKHAQVKEARLRLQRRRGELWLTIADRGRGFDPQTLGQTSGFGLLSIRERVELLGGRMKIRSAKGRGAVFLIVVKDGQIEEKAGGAESKKAGGLVAPAEISALSTAHFPREPRLRILLVDDHKIMRDGLAALIGEQTDLEVVGQAGDGRQAIELARGLGPDVVIMDVAMPTMPGDEAARQIKAVLPQTRIIALSMFEEPGVAQRMRDAGAEVYLPKTGPSGALLTAIRGKE